MTALIFDEQGFGTADGRIPWEEVRAVGIRTTDEGPFREDLFWQFSLREGFWEVPGAAVGGEQMAVMQRRLPGLDSGKIIQAMGSTDARVFRVWHPNAAWDAAGFRSRFEKLVARQGGDAGAAGAVFERLAAAWGEPARRYHDREHLVECLRALEGNDVSAATRDLAELALWFHDAVYTPGARDNESRSARLLVSECRAMGIGHEVALAAAPLVEATAHESTPPEALGGAGALVLDADLAILASEPVRFLEYDYGIEDELRPVLRGRFLASLRGPLSRSGFFALRGRFLASLLQRERIFHTALFHERCEARARENVSALLRSPRYRA